MIGTITARMQVALGARDVEEGAVLVDNRPVHAADLPLCDLCEEPFCPTHNKHYADCDCRGPMSGEVETVGALDTECGYTKATFQSVLQGHVVAPTLAVVDKQTAQPMQELSPTLKTDLSPQMGPVVAQPEAVPIQTPDRLEKGQNGLGIAAPGAPMYSLEAASVHGVVHPPALQLGRPRRLMPVETERLMGWPDSWTLVPDPRGKPMADSHRYKMCGNGVAAPVAEWIARSLLWAEGTAQ